MARPSLTWRHWDCVRHRGPLGTLHPHWLTISVCGWLRRCRATLRGRPVAGQHPKCRWISESHPVPAARPRRAVSGHVPPGQACPVCPGAQPRSKRPGGEDVVARSMEPATLGLRIHRPLGHDNSRVLLHLFLRPTVTDVAPIAAPGIWPGRGHRDGGSACPAGVHFSSKVHSP